MMMTEMDIESSVYYVHRTRLIAREDYIKYILSLIFEVKCRFCLVGLDI
jgi:hypothetical protein